MEGFKIYELIRYIPQQELHRPILEAERDVEEKEQEDEEEET